MPILPRWLVFALVISAIVILPVVTVPATPLGLYERFPWLDQVQHTLAAMLLAPVSLMIIPQNIRHEHDLGYLRTLLLGTSVWMGVAAVWELVEWSVDLVWPAADLSKGYTDSLTDLALGLGGALVALTLTHVFVRDH